MVGRAFAKQMQQIDHNQCVCFPANHEDSVKRYTVNTSQTLRAGLESLQTNAAVPDIDKATPLSKTDRKCP